MMTVFIEYKVHEELVQSYLHQMQIVLQRIAQDSNLQHQFLEAIDQHHLYVEMIQLPSDELYHQWKQLLETDDPRLPWYPILPYIVGGKKKFNMWAFRSVPLAMRINQT